ncbi:MAG: CHAT domain-containing protein [Candidatus Omnitrophica bacterium]|nr:CHAT domain-containing protein [Candidatus Omnitrophota bacterium]
MRKKIIISIFLIILPSALIFGQTEEEAYRLFLDGKVKTEENNYEAAISCFEKAIEIDTKLDNPERIALSLINIASNYDSLRQFQKEAFYWEEALKRLRKLDAPQDVALALKKSALLYYNLGQYEKTWGYLTEALEIYVKLNIPRGAADVLTYFGIAYSNMGLYNKSLVCLEQAIEIYNGSYVYPSALVEAFTMLGTTYGSLAQYEKAIVCFEKALEIDKQLGGNFKDIILNNMGVLYADFGQYDKALSCYKEAFKNDTANAIYLNNIGKIYLALRQYNEALSYFEEALETANKSENPSGKFPILGNMGELYLSQKKYKEAEKKFLLADNDSGLTDVYLATKRFNEADRLLKKMGPGWEKNDFDRVTSYTQHGLLLQGKGQLKEASIKLLSAVSLTEEIRGRIKEKEGFFISAGIIGGYTRPYRSLISVLAERALKGETQDADFIFYGRDIASSAFYFSESTKARTLLEAMAESAKKYITQELPPELRRKEQDIINQLSAIEKNWDSVYKNSAEAFKALTERKQDLKQQLDSFVSRIRKDYPKYASLNYPRPIPPEQLPLKDNEVLLEYALCDDAAYIFKVKKGGVKEIIKIPKGKEEIENMVIEFCLPFEPDLETQDIPYQDFSSSRGKILYDLLLSEALKDLPSGTKIIIVPDGILGRLPFDALTIKAGDTLEQTLFVTDKWNITYYQSATVLALNRMLRPSQAPKPIFALGNPIYNEDDPRYLAYKEKRPQPILLAKDTDKAGFRALATRADWGKTSEEDEEEDEIYFSPLPETETEIKSIARIFKVQTRPPDILLGVFANETNLHKTKLNQYRLLHFATHADLPGNVQGINEPFLLLGQVENNPQDDGLLTLSEVLNIPLDADMVVLSACITARGKTMEGEGLLNFTRAFQYAGARTVLASLWEVASEPTVEYMELLYRHLKEGKSKSEAFFLARKEMKQKYPNPFFWAVFVLHGEGC